MRLTVVTAVLVLTSCTSTILFNDGYTPDTVKNEPVCFSRPVVISATHNISNSADDSGVYLKPGNNFLFNTPAKLKVKSSDRYNETVDAFCRDMRYVAAEKERNWSLVDKKYNQRINSHFLDTSIIPTTLPESLQQALADENIHYLVVFHNFRSTFTQKSFGKSTTLNMINGTNGLPPVGGFQLNQTTGSLHSKVATRVTMYYKGKRIYSFDHKGKSKLSLEPICRGIFQKFGL